MRGVIGEGGNYEDDVSGSCLCMGGMNAHKSLNRVIDIILTFFFPFVTRPKAYG